MNGLTLLVYCLIAHQQPSQVGPENGSLLLVGGGVTPEIGRQFIALAGGVEVPMVVIPTGGGATEYSQQTPVSQLLRQLMFVPCPMTLTVYYEAYAIDDQVDWS